jgi:hypothetical protein
LVAHDGEWTRRRISGPAAARRLVRSLGIPGYDAQVLGYPRRMREYDARRRAGDVGDLIAGDQAPVRPSGPPVGGERES